MAQRPSLPGRAEIGQAGVGLARGVVPRVSRAGLAGLRADATIDDRPENRGNRGGSEVEDDPVITRIYEGHGVRFVYPSDWGIEETDEDVVVTIEVEAPGGLAFAWIRSDETCPEPADVTDEIIEALRTEYPDLDVVPALEEVAGHHATGYDIEFFSLDISNAAHIRCFRTDERTILVFGQWSDIGDDVLPEIVRGIFRSVEEIED